MDNCDDEVGPLEQKVVLTVTVNRKCPFAIYFKYEDLVLNEKKITYDKYLINMCLSCYSFLSDMVAHTCEIQKVIVRGGGGREVQCHSVRWLSRWVILSPTHV